MMREESLERLRNVKYRDPSHDKNLVTLKKSWTKYKFENEISLFGSRKRGKCTAMNIFN